jgi:cytochrome c oxidase assembly protein subunit 15
MWLGLRALGAPLRVTRAAGLLLLVELGQGVVGFVQYFTGLPWPVVLLHMLGACLVWTATLGLLLSVTPQKEQARQESLVYEGHSEASTA